MKTIHNYTHEVAAHCETGSVRNLIKHAGLEVTEPMIFGIGSGPAFYYLFFVKGPCKFPLIGIRTPPGTILKNVSKLSGIDFFSRQYSNTDKALAKAHELLEANVPVALSVDMFYMKYLPSFLHVHAPFHFIILVGVEGDRYTISDPYFEEIGYLHIDDLRAAWETHAPLAKDNSLFHVKNIPGEIDWKTAVIRGMKRTCKNMILPPVIKNLMFFVGIQGIRTYAKKIRQWPKDYSGVILREGILFNAVGFEDQGTGGGAFRLMYGAFLQEAAELLGSAALVEMADRIIEHGRNWRDISRMLIRLGKKLPTSDEEYNDWIQQNAGMLDDGLGEIAGLFEKAADVEDRFFRDLGRIAADLD